ELAGADVEHVPGKDLADRVGVDGVGQEREVTAERVERGGEELGAAPDARPSRTPIVSALVVAGGDCPGVLQTVVSPLDGVAFLVGAFVEAG
ncbi:hypothetical protein, partial [Streptomyces misionensis]|uniref:hypothetical protein n=1 Tax=Streptomyces misionensis TaxID=67331 RepID=UPI003F4CF03D